MSETEELHRWTLEIMRGRLALALVSARVRQCPDRRCARVGRCLACADPSEYLVASKGHCRNMSETEWRACRRGIQLNLARIGENGRREKAAAELDNLPPDAPTAEEEARREGREPWPYHWFLWLEPDGDSVLTVPPSRVRALNAKLLAHAARHHCRCAQERRRMGPECLDRCLDDPPPVSREAALES